MESKNLGNGGKFFIGSLNPGYDRDKRWEIMRKISDTINRPEGKLLSNEDYDNA